jgi:hypothetical protein
MVSTVTVKDAPWLEFVARMMGEAPSTTSLVFDPALFHCLLDEQPSHLVPPYFFSSQNESPCSSLLWNPTACLCRDGKLPPQQQDRDELVSRFDLQGPVVWVQDPANESWQPFWIGPTLRKWLDYFQPGEPAPRNLPSDVRSVLANAGILVAADYVAHRRKRWADIVQRARSFFPRGFAPVAGLIHPYHIAELRRYVRRRIRNRQVHLGDGQSPLRYIEYNDPVLKFFHQQLTPALSDIAGEMLKPSYTYMASYLKGAELPKHTDRLQCEFTVSLCLDFAPEPVGQTPWPLHLDTPDGTITVFQRIGDALFFRGRQIPHYRKPLARGTTSTSIFFHYVRKGFAGQLD